MPRRPTIWSARTSSISSRVSSISIRTPHLGCHVEPAPDVGHPLGLWTFRTAPGGRLGRDMRAKNERGRTIPFRELPPAGRALIGAAVAWSLAWKGASLWRAARNESKPWFVALLLSNTLGVLDAIYL